MTDIRAFLTARYDEQQQHAQQCIEDAPLRTIHLSNGGTEQVREGVGYWRYVLDDLAAKRAILAEYDAALANRKRHPDDLACTGWLLGTVRVMKLLAHPFRSHPDYDPAWRIEP